VTPRRIRPLAAATLALMLGGSALAGCFQELDTAAAAGPTLGSSGQPAGGSAPSGVDVEPGENQRRTPTTSLETPPIELENGTTTTDPCVATRLQAHGILRDNCSKCHQAPARQGQPPFDFVLEVDRLVAARSTTVKDPQSGQPARFLVPGQPDQSRLYVRIAADEMPPRDVVGLPPNPKRPSISDLSVLRTWISDCLSAAVPPAP
jgi:hypothetical protein